MTRILLLFFLLAPLPAAAEMLGVQGLNSIKHCIMENDATICHASLTPNSFEIFDKFSGYKLMPCLPTDFSYESESKSGESTIVKATMPEDERNDYVFNLVFLNTGKQMKLDIPATLHLGLGENWRNKLDISEQLFLMMRNNMKDKLTCNVLHDLVMPGNT